MSIEEKDSVNILLVNLYRTLFPYFFLPRLTLFILCLYTHYFISEIYKVIYDKM